MKKLFIVAFASLLVLTSCKGEKKESFYPVEAFSQTVEKRPQRVVCLSPWAEEAMVVLGYKNTLVGDEQSFENPDFPKTDEILALNPDLVIGGGELPPSIKKAVDEKGIKLFSIPRFNTEQEIIDSCVSLALAFEGSEVGALRKKQIEYFASGYDKCLVESSARLIGEFYKESPPKILWAVGKDYAATPDTLEGQWLNQIGFVNAALDYSDYYAPLDSTKDNADIILYPSHLEEDFKDCENALMIPYDAKKIMSQSLSLFTFREQLLNSIFPEGKMEAKDIIMPMPKPVEEPLKWYEKLFGKKS